ncbi:hypothetical protein BSKO_06198 [Bryopsis sp. KO-2023]|nr:hypothetical protein BSKO_06198 [Bryopsis sp. KO-2023]
MRLQNNFLRLKSKRKSCVSQGSDPWRDLATGEWVSDNWASSLTQSSRPEGRHRKTNSCGADVLNEYLLPQVVADMDAQQKCVTNLAATVVRQDQQIRELKAHIRQLESITGRPGTVSRRHHHDRSHSDGFSDTTTAASSSCSDLSSGSSPASSTKTQEPLLSSILEAEEEMRAALMESKQILTRVNTKQSENSLRKRRDGSLAPMYTSASSHSSRSSHSSFSSS